MVQEPKNPFIGKVFKSGTSKVVSLPKKLRQLFNLDSGDLVEIEVKRKVQ